MTHPNAEQIEALARDRVMAHAVLFPHRHPDATPAFHYKIIKLWHSLRIKRGLVMAFREAGKSTIAEEAIIIQALLQMFRNAVLIGENQPRAIDRVNAIKHELVYNEAILSLFGEQVGEVWGSEKIILKNGVVIQALGRRMEVRGMKHLDIRPDLMFGDDLEGKEHVKDANVRHETLQWLFAEVIPALDKNARVRIQATPLDREALPMTIRSQRKDWETMTFPIRYKDQETGKWVATWPARYPVEWIKAKEDELYSLGLHHDFMREYMCEAEDPAKKVFTASMFNVVPRQHVWQPCFAIFDPARTTNPNSASTGWCVISWTTNNRMIIWDGGGDVLKPDEIINLIFKVYQQYHPVSVGIERDGLEEFIMQPLRNAMLQRGIVMKIEPLKAPKGKEAFIEGLQPMFQAGMIELAKPLPDMVAQFLSYPTGKIDAPNAMAYAPGMRPGQPIYDNFGNEHVVPQLLRWEKVPFWLCLNATSARTTGVLVQLCDGAIHVLADWVRLGDPGANVEVIANEAKLEADTSVRPIAAPSHFAQYDTVGLNAAVKRIPAELRHGGTLLEGRAVIRELLQRNHRGVPMVQVSQEAHWTTNAMASGYCRQALSDGTLKQEPRDDVYKTLIEGLEAFAGLLKIGMLEEDRATNWATNARGVPYKTIIPGQTGVSDAKSKWLAGPPPDSLDIVNSLSVLRRPR